MIEIGLIIFDTPKLEVPVLLGAIEAFPPLKVRACRSDSF